MKYKIQILTQMSNGGWVESQTINTDLDNENAVRVFVEGIEKGLQLVKGLEHVDWKVNIMLVEGGE
tara:strand:+ start:209 stop:406 length:198 start_codon:yes stop_codon:yes gene_type:complete